MSADKSRALDRKGLLKGLKQAVTEPGVRNILLAGPWGSGKTALLEDFGEEIEAAAPPDEAGSFFVFRFSPWNTVADGNAGRAFMRVLHGELLNARKKGESSWDNDTARRVDGYLNVLQDLLEQDDVKAILETLVPGGRAMSIVSGGLIALGRKPLGNRHKNKEPAGIEELRQTIHELLSDILKAHGKQRMLLLVDDLDRARPEEAVSILDSLYHLFLPHAQDTDWPLTSIWAVNTAVLEEFLYREYRELPSFDPNAYLEKLFEQRLNVPPLFHVSGSADGPRRLWQLALEPHCEHFAGLGILVPELSRQLAEKVNYAILGNLRLHERLRRDCLRLWCDMANAQSPGDGEAEEAPTLDRFVRQARLLTLIDAFPTFRERIAPYNGMWPAFLNPLNRRLAERDGDLIANPLYRHMDSPDLATLLVDLGVMRYDRDRACYVLIPEGRLKLQRDLNRLWGCGV